MNKCLHKFYIYILLAVFCFFNIQQNFAISVDEYSIKAAFLVKFIDFISWENMNSNPRQLITIVGTDPFGSILDNYVRKAQKRNKLNLKIEREMHPDPDLDGQIIFSSEKNPTKIALLIKQIKNKRVLLVGEGEQFAELGGTIAFIIKNNKIRFVINLNSAKRAGLNISSKLLRLAKVIQ